MSEPPTPPVPDDEAKRKAVAARILERMAANGPRMTELVERMRARSEAATRPQNEGDRKS